MKIEVNTNHEYPLTPEGFVQGRVYSPKTNPAGAESFLLATDEHNLVDLDSGVQWDYSKDSSWIRTVMWREVNAKVVIG